MRAAHFVLAVVLMGSSSLSAVAGTGVDGHDLTLAPRATADATVREGGSGPEGGASGSGRDCSTAGGADAARDCGSDGSDRAGGGIDNVGARHRLSWQSLLPGSIQ